MPEEMPSTNQTEVQSSQVEQGNQKKRNSVPYILLALFLLIAVSGGAFAIKGHSSKNKGVNPDEGKQQGAQRDSNPDHQQGASVKAINSNTTDPEEKGRALSGNMCAGTGSKTLTSAPLAASDIGVIIPMGNMIGGHVTPIDHEYYFQKDPSAKRDTYAVMAPADGNIVNIQHRGQFIGNASDAPAGATDEYRLVISYSCTFFSYYDLVTSLDPSVSSLLPSDFATTGRMGSAPIPVKAGQVIAHVGGQSLDFAVWDTTKPVTGLLNPVAFNNAEAWKIVTVPALNYWSDAVKATILPFYARTAEPRDGKFDYDVNGTAIGDWFLAGSNGYFGSTDAQSSPKYYAGHLAIAPDSIDTKSFIFSIGSYNGGDATQFAIVGNTPDPATITPQTGIVKYTLAGFDHILANGQKWTGSTPASGITVKAGQSKAVVLVQLTDAQTMKVEVFPGMTTDKVTGFDAGAQTFNRGQDAKMVNP